MTVEIKNITKSFGKQKALDNVSFSVKNGILTGFLGPNGAGKSTMMRIITGFLLPDSGKVLMDNRILQAENPEFRRIIGYLPEHNPLYTELYVKEFLEITAGLYKLHNKKQRVAEMIERTGLGEEQHKKIGALSKGYRQRVGLAQALIHDPQVLILDEPTTGLDPNQLEEIRTLIKETGRQKTVIFSTHIMQEAEALCEQVLIIHKGRIVADGNISEIKNLNLVGNQWVIAEFAEQVSERALLLVNGVKNAHRSGKMWELEAERETDIRPAIFRFAADNHLTLLTLHEKHQNLENIFHELTQRQE